MDEPKDPEEEIAERREEVRQAGHLLQPRRAVLMPVRTAMSAESWRPAGRLATPLWSSLGSARPAALTALAEQPLAGDRVVASVAQGVAPEDPPGAEDDTAGRPILLDGVERVLGARGIELAPGGQPWRDHQLIPADGAQEERPHRVADRREESLFHEDGRRTSGVDSDSRVDQTREALRKTSSIFASTAFDPPSSSSSMTGVRAMRTKSMFPLRD